MQCALLDVGTTQRARCADISRSIDLPRQTGESGFAGALSAVGYDTAFIGKAHFATANTFAPTGSGE